MNLNTPRVCSLPSYPGVDGRGPVVLTYLEDQCVLAACGSFADSDQSCYQLSPDQSSGWQPLGEGQLINHHCPSPESTRNHFLRETGWFLVGQEDGRCRNDSAAMSTELLTPELQWVQLPITSPFNSIAGYPAFTCSVAIDSNTIIVTGGYNGIGVLPYTLKLDLTDYTWTQLKDIPTPRYGHGCTTTATGELIIAGGYDGTYIQPSVYIYNLMSNTWSRASFDLPAGWASYNYPVMFLWNKQPIIVEWYSSNIWRLDGSTWKKMVATMGDYFDGLLDTSTTVPSGIFSC